MDYTLIITTRSHRGHTTTACATHTDVQNLIVNFVRYTTETNYIIEVVTNS